MKRIRRSIPTLTLFLAALLLACDQGKQAQALGRCVVSDERLSTVIKDPQKAKVWVKEQREAWAQVRARIASGTTPFVTDELAQKLIDSEDVLNRISVCLELK